jgi:hypothetical protein
VNRDGVKEFSKTAERGGSTVKNAEIRLLGREEKRIYTGRITDLPVPEDHILNKSMELFNDPAPCFIHRSAVLKRLYLEAEEYLEDGRRQGKTEWDWEELPFWLRQTLTQDTRVYRVQYARNKDFFLGGGKD